MSLMLSDVNMNPSAQCCNSQKENHYQHLCEAVNPVQPTQEMEQKINLVPPSLQYIQNYS